MRKVDLDFVFKGINYAVVVYRSDGLALKIEACIEGDWVVLDGDLPEGLDERISEEWQEYLAENGLELDWE
jgi:hypothetical protein